MLPNSIQKLPNGRLLVSYGDTSEEFDTVLEAIGRTPDLAGLNMSALSEDGNGPKVHGSSGKLLCQNEQTSIPHVYAIGDVVHTCPELTPVAILAGKLLARRLFGGSGETVEYRNIATAVFTPLELGTVGLTEKEAAEVHGEDAIDCFIASFSPLEWSITDNHTDLSCFAKIVVLKEQNNKV